MATFNTKMTAIADAIRLKTNRTDTLTLDEMEVAIDGIEAGGNTDIEDGLVTGNIKNYTNSRVTSIRPYAFTSCSSLTTANFPAVTSIGNCAFYRCSSLTTASFPAATYIGSSAFTSCSSLTTASFPAATYIGSSAFYSCSSLTTASFPAATYIGSSAFYGCRSLTTASFPAATYIGGQAFYDCRNISNIYLLASSVCRLYTSKVFAQTGITSTTGSIFVPASLQASYQAETNWTYFSSRIFAYEG